jgi:hypothetical protein
MSKKGEATMKFNTFTFNLFALITYPFAAWLGVTGRVDWWIIVLILVANIEMSFTYKRKQK